MDKLIRIEQGAVLLNPSISVAIAEFEKQIKDLKSKEDALKQRILAEMEEHGILKIDTDELAITYVAETSRETFDSKSFRKDNPELYDEYVKISTVAASVRMKVK